MNIVEVKNLSFTYSNGVEVLKNINIAIFKGSYCSILGHNGSGKSTLAKVIMGLLPNYKGEIFINGNELKKENMSQIRRDITMVFQNPDNQFIGNTVEDDIAFGLENACIPHGEIQSIINDFSKRVGMDKYLEKEPSYLSGGQKQRVAIAGVLALSPKVIIFDEATSMLDPKGKKEILALINEIRKNNRDLTVISITHDVEEAYSSDYVFVMNHGEIAVSGEPKKVFENSELIESLNLRLPVAMLLRSELNKAGFDIPEDADIETIGDIVCQSK